MASPRGTMARSQCRSTSLLFFGLAERIIDDADMVALQEIYIVGSLECRRMLDIVLAHSSTDIIKTGHLACREGGREAFEQCLHVRNSVAQQRGSRHHDIGTNQQVFEYLLRCFDPGTCCD